MSGHAGGRAALTEALFRVGALRLGRFTRSGGKPSSYQLDLAAVPSDPEAYGLAISALRVVLEGMGEGGFEALAGVATTGLNFSAPLAHLL